MAWSGIHISYRFGKQSEEGTAHRFQVLIGESGQAEAGGRLNLPDPIRQRDGQINACAAEGDRISVTIDWKRSAMTPG